jgi:riboflavin synthase
MFNGIIFDTGRVEKILKENKSFKIFIKTQLGFKKYEIGSSVSCNGTCLTLTSIKKDIISFYLSNETLAKTNYKFTKKGKIINIEKSLNYGTKVSGHYVQGHTDTVAKVLKIIIADKAWTVRFHVDKLFGKYLIEKGSIAINGVSLTISKTIKNKFEVNIIPHTLRLTNLIKLKKNDLVNIELDIFSKYLINLKK